MMYWSDSIELSERRFRVSSRTSAELAHVKHAFHLRHHLNSGVSLNAGAIEKVVKSIATPYRNVFRNYLGRRHNNCRLRRLGSDGMRLNASITHEQECANASDRN